MRVGIISDIHSNAEGLACALALMGTVEALLCAGDVLADGRVNNDVISMLREANAVAVAGNQDLAMRSRSTVASLSEPNATWWSALPLHRDVQIGPRRVRISHATPCSDEWTYVRPGHLELRRIGELDIDIVVLGHTHIQMAERVNGTLIINPGSVGQARDRANGYQLSFAVLDPLTEMVEFTNFDLGSS